MATFWENSAHHLFEKDIEPALQALAQGGMVLVPTDTVWSVVAQSGNPSGMRRIKHFLEQTPGAEGPELLVASVNQVKQYVAHLHPRLETLWVYHLRPLSVYFDDPVSVPDEALYPDGHVVIRLVLDDFIRELIQRADSPLVAVPALGKSGIAPANFGAVSSEVLQQVDYVAKYRQNEKSEGELSVMVRITDAEELDFIRE